MKATKANANLEWEEVTFEVEVFDSSLDAGGSSDTKEFWELKLIISLP